MRVFKILWIGLLGVLWVVRLRVWFGESAPSQFDFGVYLAAANTLRLHPHTNIYQVAVIAPHTCVPLTTAAYAWPYIYPPLLAILMEPLSLVPCGVALMLWQAVNVALWLVLVALLVRYLPRHRVLLFPLGLFFTPFWNTLYYGQISGFLLLGLMAVPWLVERQRMRWAGVVLGMLAAIKLLPAILILYFVARRQWSGVVSMVLPKRGGVVRSVTRGGPRTQFPALRALASCHAAPAEGWRSVCFAYPPPPPGP